MASFTTRCTFILLIALISALYATGKEVMIVTSGSAAPDTCYLSQNAPMLQRVPLDGVATWIATPVPVSIEGKLETARLDTAVGTTGPMWDKRSFDQRGFPNRTLRLPLPICNRLTLIAFVQTLFIASPVTPWAR